MPQDSSASKELVSEGQALLLAIGAFRAKLKVALAQVSTVEEFRPVAVDAVNTIMHLLVQVGNFSRRRTSEMLFDGADATAVATLHKLLGSTVATTMGRVFENAERIMKSDRAQSVDDLETLETVVGTTLSYAVALDWTPSKSQFALRDQIQSAWEAALDAPSTPDTLDTPVAQDVAAPAPSKRM